MNKFLTIVFAMSLFLVACDKEKTVSVEVVPDVVIVTDTVSSDACNPCDDVTATQNISSVTATSDDTVSSVD